MNKLIRLYNQNRALMIAIILVIALIIIIIQVLNHLVKEENKRKANEINSSANNGTTISKENVSSITGENVRNSELKTNVIKRFVEYCNNGKLEEAYNMLTEECRQDIYPSLEKFKTSYYDKIFYIYRLYSLENWYSRGNLTTYSIKYVEDALATGNANSNDNMSDYITVAQTEKGNYLNINSYVASDNINKSSTQNGITITVEKSNIYMNYLVLDLKIVNTTNETICIDTKKENNTMYLYDTNKVKYIAFLNENFDEELKVKGNSESKVSIKFNKMYNPESRELSRSRSKRYSIKL